jgi:hypothetical protein
MSELIAWLISSSSNPAAMGMTVRGVLVVLVPLIASLFGLGQDDSNALVEAIVQLVVSGMTLMGVAMTVFGLVRKLYLGRWSHPEA